ncbi:MAG: SGNH/GDSL hydrolase family protein, partial [Candidatus Aminicenantes bacterium]|nr:SGNH/GDSL hydrolase family protein [Candidatus Aminicenantes bacterium]
HLEDKKEILRGQKANQAAFTNDELNTIVGIGDSVTWGKMRMFEFIDSYHPELTYLAKTSDYFNENYGDTSTINLGVNRDSSLDGVERMDEELLYGKGYFFLVLFGTNDVTSGTFSSTSTSKNIQWILENARNNYGMFPVVSTVPPQKLYLAGVQFYKEQTEKLNGKIILMASAQNFSYIDSYDAFFDQDEDWETMLEDVKGNHPSPSGHQVMADMVIPILLSLIPEVPSNVNFSANTSGNSFNVSCTQNNEFDFSHYNVKFGFTPTQLDREMTYTSNNFTIYFYPFNLNLKRMVYFKMQSVDKDGNSSEFTDIYSIFLN